MQTVMSNVLERQEVSTCYKVFTIQSEDTVRSLLEDGAALGDQECSLPADQCSLVYKSFEILKNKPLRKTPFFGWISFGHYPVEVEDLFAEMFFARTLTDVNLLRLSPVCEKYYLLELNVPLSEAALVNVDNLEKREASILESPPVSQLDEFLLSTGHCLFASLKLPYLVSASRLVYEGNLEEFEDNGRHYRCRNFNPPKGVSLTPELIECERFYKDDSLCVWSIIPLKTSEVIDRKYTWPVGSSFLSLNVVPQ